MNYACTVVTKGRDDIDEEEEEKKTIGICGSCHCLYGYLVRMRFKQKCIRLPLPCRPTKSLAAVERHD